MGYVTWSDFFQFSIALIAYTTLIITVYHNIKK